MAGRIHASKISIFQCNVKKFLDGCYSCTRQDQKKCAISEHDNIKCCVTKYGGLFVTFRLNFVILKTFSPLLTELAIGTPTQEEKCEHDEDATNDGCKRERLPGAEPVDDSDEEDRQKRGNRGEDGRCERNEDKERSREC